MPSNKKKIGAPAEFVSEINETLSAAGLCGHINKQHYNTEGELEDLACTLPKGHAPVLMSTEKVKDEKNEIHEVQIFGVVHSAEYEFMKAEIIPPLKQRVEGKTITYVKVKKLGEWTDAAGVSAPQKQPEV